MKGGDIFLSWSLKRCVYGDVVPSYHGRHVSSYRPLEITTQEFSKKWGTFTYEKKLKLQYSMSKPEEFMEAVKSKLNFHLIQIIGKIFFTEFRSWN